VSAYFIYRPPFNSNKTTTKTRRNGGTDRSTVTVIVLAEGNNPPVALDDTFTMGVLHDPAT